MILGFELFIDGGTYDNAIIDVGMEKPYNLPDLPSETAYDWKVRAYDNWGNRSAWTELRSTATLESGNRLLDNITSTPKLALGLRKLRSSYSGACLRVKRADNNVESDIGFSGNLLDVTALSTAGSGTTLSLITVYDQSVNANHLTFSGTAPTIAVVSGEAIITWNENCSLKSGATISYTTPKIFTVIGPSTVTINNYIWDCGSNHFLAQFDGGVLRIYNASPVDKTGVATGKQQISVIYQTGDDTAFVNGVELTSATGNAGDSARTSVFTLGGYGGANGYGLRGKFYELILIDGALGSDQAIIEVDQMDFYGL